MTTQLIAGAGGMVPYEAAPDYDRHNKGITSHFFIKREPLLDEKGHPILDACGKPSESEIELCTISIAGDLLSEVTGPAVDGTPMSPHIRIADAYAKWKSGEETSSGTRLSGWGEPGLTPRMLRDLADLHIESVEDLANVSDAHIPRLVDGRMWRQKAVAWIATHPSPEEASEIQKLKAANEVMAARLAALEKAAKTPKPSSAAVRKKMEALRERKAAKHPSS
jgi:hypothetical protein